MRVGIDLGSTDIKVAPVTPEFEFREVITIPMPTSRDGDRVTHTPGDVLDRVRSIPRKIKLEGPWKAAIASQRSTFVLWDRETGDPQTPLISWRDRRAEPWVESLTDQQFQTIREVTGLRPEAGYPLPKLCWCFEINTELRSLAQDNRLCYGSLDTWLTWVATGGDQFIMDTTQASRSLLYNPVERTWSDRLIEEFGVPPSILPELSAGLDDPLPADGLWSDGSIVSLVGDQPASTIGGQPPPYERTRVTLGTGGFVASPCDPEDVPEGLNLSFTPTDTDPVYQAEGVVLSAGRAVDWLLDVLELEHGRLTKFMDEPWPGDLPMCCPALNGVGAPFWSNRAGAIRSLTEDTGRRELVLGMVVSVLMRIHDILERLPEATQGIVLDGGLTRVKNLLSLARVLWDRDVRRMNTAHLTCRGALIRSHWNNPYFKTGPWENTGVQTVSAIDGIPADTWHSQWEEALSEWGLSS
jgi:glycerol kinase